jgi:hypothetical protein
MTSFDRTGWVNLVEQAAVMLQIIWLAAQEAVRYVRLDQ